MSEQGTGSLSLLADELKQVDEEVRAVVSDLRAPFSQLVQSRLRNRSPLLCAAFVLTAGAGAAENQSLASKRIYLAAAIEVLRLALAVHTRLLGPGELGVSVDRSLLGSTVLAGDFCFSRSAGLAAKTDSPVVVDIFAQALQRVSEGTLRGLFNAGDAMFDVERELCLSGVAAANELAGLSEQERQGDQALAALLLDSWQGRTLSSPELAPLLAGSMSSVRRAHWQALQEWLQAR